LKVAERPGFDEWVQPFLAEAGDGRDVSQSAALVRWFRSVFDEVGPISRAEVHRRYQADQVAAAEEAVRLVMRDAAVTANAAANVVVDTDGNCIRISYNGSYTTPSMFEIDRASAIAEVGDYLQEHISESLWRAWPVCPDHDLGLRARVRHGEPVWWCESGQHAAGSIGGLETG